MARGKTLPELKEIINKEYTKIIDNITVTLILKVMQAKLAALTLEFDNPMFLAIALYGDLDVSLALFTGNSCGADKANPQKYCKCSE